MDSQLSTAKRAALEHFAPMRTLGRYAPLRLQDPVVGVGVGDSRLRIYVDASQHSHDVPQAFGDVPTEVIETPGFATQAGPPVNCGVSIGLLLRDTGTLGCLVQDGDGTRYLLSNNHVLAATNRGVIGDPIVHPGHHDGGTSPADDIATLAHFVPIDFAGPNHVDAAIESATNQPIGLLFAADDRQTLANPIDLVLAALHVS